MDLVVSFEGGKKVNAEYKGHTIKTDQPVQAGGDDSAPAPFDLFLASIGTCAGIYVNGFCTSRGIDPTGIRIVQKMKVSPETRLVSEIDLDIQLPEGFPERYKEAVINAAELCAVKKHLHNPPSINVKSSVLNEVQ